MKVKKEYLILASLIVALSLYVFFRQQDRTHYDLPVLEEVSPSKIMKIEISRGEGPPVLLERRAEGWMLMPEAYPADQGKATVMLESLRNLTLSALISESKSYERYGLARGDGIRVKAWTGQGLKRDFEVGKEAPSFQHTFVKIAGDGRVFHARENLKVRFDQSLDDLRDKSVLTLDPAEVVAIELREGEAFLRLTRRQDPAEEGPAQGSWESPAGEVDEAGVSDLLSALSNLKCSAFIYDLTRDDFGDPLYTVTLEGSTEHFLALFDGDEETRTGYPAISSQNESPFLLPEHQAERIMLSLERFFKP